MTREHRKIRFFLVWVSIHLISGLYAYSHYCSLSEADFFSVQSKFEVPDQTGPLRFSKDEPEVFRQNSFNHLFFPDNNILKKLSIISLEASPIDLTAFMLRC